MQDIRLGILWILLLLPLAATSQQLSMYEYGSIESNIHHAVAYNDDNFRQDIMPEPMYVDSLFTPDIPFTPMAVSMHGYVKKYNEVHETFILRNETRNYRISRVLLRLLYINKDGDVVADRQELVECDIAAGATQTIKLRSFDGSAPYYYYKTPTKAQQATPFKLKYDVVRYDVVVERNTF